MVVNLDSELREILEKVKDPEVPVLSILDLGIVREITNTSDLITIKITPTYTGCPAMDMIAVDIKAIFQEHGYQNVEVDLVLSPAWTTDWISENGKRKLKEYGIAPPVHSSDKTVLIGDKIIPCPQCDSENTQMISQFGSTACKALYKCLDCKEPFDYFKCH